MLKKVFLSLISLLIFSFTAIASPSTPLANNFLESHSIEDAVSQLIFVGIPSDFNTIDYDKPTKRLLEHNIGGVILNAYNLPGYSLEQYNKKNAYSYVYHFIKEVRSMSDDNNLLIAVDFESSRFTSLRYPFTPPPSALSISSTNQTIYAYLSGKLVGHQLQQAGINVLLGPVLDLAKPTQGKLNTALKNRSWGSNLNLTLNMAGRFIDGVKEHNIITIGKHVPGFGSVNSNPHNKESRYDGSLSSLKNELDIIDSLSNYLDGIMTSHVSLSFSKIEDPLTVSKKLVDKIFKKLLSPEEFTSKLLVTDDLSDMESIKLFNNKKGWDYDDLALAAFKAGHDILLFSHLKPHSDFGLDDLESVIGKLSHYTKSKDGMKKLKASLEKILNIKSKLNNTTFLGVNPTKKFDFDSKDIFINTAFSNTKDFIEKTYDKATIIISKNKNLKDFSILDSLEPHEGVMIFGRSKYLKEIRNHISDDRISYAYKEKYESKKRKLNFNKYRGAVIKSLKKKAFVIFFAENQEDYDLAHHIYLYENKFNSKFIVVVNESPDILKRETLINSNLIGSFSQDKYSAKSIAKIINGEITPNGVQFSPIDLNDGTFFDTSERPYVQIDENSPNRNFLFKTTEEKKLFEKITGIQHQFYMAFATALLPLIILIMIIIYFIAAYIDINYSDFKKRLILKPLNPNYFRKKHPYLTGLLVMIAIFEVLLFIPNSFVIEFLSGYVNDDMREFIINSAKKAKENSPDIFGDAISQW